jgi:hypothetical protein
MESIPLDAQEQGTKRERYLSVIAGNLAIKNEFEDFLDFNDLSGDQQFAFGD